MDGATTTRTTTVDVATTAMAAKENGVIIPKITAEIRTWFWMAILGELAFFLLVVLSGLAGLERASSFI